VFVFGMTSPFYATATITTAMLVWKTYLSWSGSVELWFVG